MKDIAAPRRAPVNPTRKFDCVDKSNVFQMINRYYGLTAAQKAILYFVFDRTMCWGKTDERISLNHFEHGVFGKDGTCWCSGVGFSLPIIKRTLKELRANGLLLASGESGSAYRYRLNIRSLMATPKRCLPSASPGGDSHSERYGFFEDSGFQEDLMPSREVVSDPVNILPTPPANFRGGRGSEEIAPKEQERKEPEKKEQKTCGASRTDINVTSLDKVVNTFDSSTTSKGAASFKKQIISVLKETWDSVFPGTYVPPSEDRRFALNAVMGKFPQQAQALEWMKWCIENWTILGSTRLRWMTPFPETPSIGLMIGGKSHIHFVEAWQSRKVIEQIAALPAEEQAIHRLMHEKGLTYTVAREAFQKRDITRQEAEANELRAQRLNVREEAMVRREQVNARVMQAARQKIEVPKQPVRPMEEVAAEIAAMEEIIPEPWKD